MRILSFDIESTTGSHSDGSMCTFGYCSADSNLNIIEQKDIVMNPKTRRFETKIKLHYEKEFIKKCERFPHFYNDIKNLFIGHDYIIGFSVMNDVEFLNNACYVYNLTEIEYDFIDVQLLYKTVYNKPTLTALQTIAEELNIDYTAHRSDEDARVTFLVLKHILNDKGLNIEELLKKYHITPGLNRIGDVTPCSNGVFTRREMNYLILDFVEKNFKHSRRYKGGLSQKTFAFTDEFKYGNIDRFRRILKRIYELNGRVSSIETSNIFVNSHANLPTKYVKALELRNMGKERIKVVTEEEFMNMLGNTLPYVDFSSDVTLIKDHRHELRKQKLLKAKIKKQLNNAIQTEKTKNTK